MVRGSLTESTGKSMAGKEDDLGILSSSRYRPTIMIRFTKDRRRFLLAAIFYWFEKDRETDGSGFSHDVKIKPEKLKIFLHL